MDRYLIEPGTERWDDLGLLDLGRTPRVVSADVLEQASVASVQAPPWLGKTTLARELLARLRCGAVDTKADPERVELTELGLKSSARDVPPRWWGRWIGEESPAVWIIDGLDEAADLGGSLLWAVLAAVERLPPAHRNHLKLLLFSRPHPDVAAFLDRLEGFYPPFEGPSPHRYELARLDRLGAEQLIGNRQLEKVAVTIKGNGLRSIAGYPVVLRYLSQHPEAVDVGLAGVWKGVLLELLGQGPGSDPRFRTSVDDRFEAACRIAAILTLTRRHAIRRDSMKEDEPTIALAIGSSPGSNARRMAAAEACRTAAFHGLAEEGVFRFAHRNVQDWFTAFALAGLPARVLESVLCQPNGELRSRLREPAMMLRQVAADWAARELLGESAGLLSGLADPSPSEAVRLLDHIESLAEAAGRWNGFAAEDQSVLTKLDLPGVDVEISRRLTDPDRSPLAKRVLFDVAETIKATEAVEPSVQIALDRVADKRLRRDAIGFVCRFGGSDHLKELTSSLLCHSPVADDGDDVFRGRVLYELLGRGLWPLWRAALYAPPREPGLVDHRTMVLHRLGERLALDDARQILPRFNELLDRHADPTRRRPPRFLERAIALVRDQDEIAARDVRLLSDVIVGLLGREDFWFYAPQTLERLSTFPEARRRIYARDAERVLAGGSPTVAGRGRLDASDLEWLLGKAVGEWRKLPDVWFEVLQLAEAARERGLIENLVWKDIEAAIEGHSPGLISAQEERRRRFQEQEEEWRSRRATRTAARPSESTLADVVRNALAAQGRDPVALMGRLGFLCFHPELRPDHIRGEWDDLAEDLRIAVLDAFRSALETEEPSSSRRGRVTERSLGEASAFEKLVLHEPADWLDETLIRKWLPVGLSNLWESWTGLIRACWTASRSATEQVLEAEIRDFAGRGELSQLWSIPSECWPGPVGDLAESLVADGATPRDVRAELAEVLAVRDPARPLPYAGGWAALSDDADRLRQAGRSVLLLREPIRLLGLLQEDVEHRGRAALAELGGLTGRSELRPDWASWPLELREKLASLLLRCFPLKGSEDEDDDGRSDELVFLRDQVLGTIIWHREAESSAAADRLASSDPALAASLAAYRASAAASQAIREAGLTASVDPEAVTLDVARRLLDRKDFRLIRSCDDLLDAVVFALEKIEAEVGYDLPLLYGPPAKGGRSRGGTNATESGRKHLREDALQAYLRRRLTDVMPAIADGVAVQLLREDQVAYRHRLDIRVTAPCHGSRELATVVVEAKWSDNPETRTGLAEQLGTKYLLGERLTRGAYVVAWTGAWKPEKSRRGGRDKDALIRHLESERQQFCRSGGPGAGTWIEPIVLDLCWHFTEAGTT